MNKHSQCVILGCSRKALHPGRYCRFHVLPTRRQAKAENSGGMKYLSVCSGIEAATVAWHPLGWSAVGYSEIEKLPSAVLQHHYPDVPNYGDMNDFKNWPDTSFDVLVGGTPCQSFSVAGLRKGMADPRGNLALVYLAILDRFRPRWLVWENVPGVLSSNEGRDFGAIIGAMVKLGYGVAYRVLDAKHFGIPQRRRRVFVVGYLGDWRRAAEVLFEPESLRRNPPPGREKGQGVAGTITESAARRRGSGQQPESLIPDVANPLTRRMHKGINTTCDEGQTAIVERVAAPLTAGSSSPGVSAPSRRREDDENIVAIQERATNENSDAGPDGEGVRTDGQAYTLEARSVPKAVVFESRYARNGRGAPDTVCPPLKAQSGQTGKGDAAPLTMQGMQVRRLTPLECTRLQGFPDDYFDGVPGRSDSQVYKALGNSMAVPCMRWIGQRIEKNTRN